MSCSTVASSRGVAADCATWPADQQERWKALFDPERNRRPPWVRQTQYQNAGVYSRFLECAGRSGFDPALCPDAVRSFVAECEAAACEIITISGYLWAIWKVLRKVHAGALGGIEWFYQTCLNFDHAAKETVREGATRKIDSAEISVAGDQLIAEAREIAARILSDAARCDSDGSVPAAESPGPGNRLPWAAVQCFRDGLFLLVGTYVPERRRALTDIRIGQLDLERGIIRFEPHQIKMKRPTIRPFPASVVALLNEWLQIWRPAYAQGHDRLWIAKGGRGAGSAALYAAMKKATARTLGAALTPHELRDAAATLAVEESPETARLASIVLDHRNSRVTRAYTEQADQIAAGRALSRAISRGAETTERKVRSVSRSTIALNPRSRRRMERPTAKG